MRWLCVLPAILLLTSPCIALRHGGAILLSKPDESQQNATASTNGSSSDSGNSTQNMQVVVMVMTAPGAREWRMLVRKHWPEMSRDVTVLGRKVDMILRFAVGKALDIRHDATCLWEAAKYGDIAFLKVQDGIREKHSDMQHGGKIWYLFKWALDHFPQADLYFKQDDDSIVNWRIALPTMLNNSWRPAKLPFERMYLGRLQIEDGFRPCGMGELYGFSKDIVMFGTTFTKPKEQTEDVYTCEWTEGMEQFTGRGSIDRGGLLAWPDYENSWIHPVKDQLVYEACFENLAEGCLVSYPWEDFQNITFRLLPDVEAARSWLAHNSTGKEVDIFHLDPRKW